jgi:hypothetical protein
MTTLSAGTITDAGMTLLIKAQMVGGTPITITSASITSDVLACDGTERNLGAHVVYTMPGNKLQFSSPFSQMLRTLLALDTSVGDFVIGTVGLFVGNTLFAVASFPGAGNKVRSNLPTKVGNERYLMVDIIYEGVNPISNSLTLGAYASVDNAHLTGVPTAPTAAAGTNTTQLATTAFVVAAVVAAGSIVASNVLPIMDGVATIGTSALYARADHVHPTDTSKAGLASPGFTGTPTAPTAANGTSNTQLATTQFVANAIVAAGSVVPSNASPLANGSVNPGTSALYSRADHVHPTDTTRASVASPSLTGTPLAPTAAFGTNTTQLATTAFVRTEFLGRVVYASDYGATGNGSTDDTAALTNFFNHANSNPGVEHRLLAGRYLITSALPDITASGTWISGVPSFIHNAGNTLSGTVIVWGGGSGATMLTLRGRYGAGLQNLCGVRLEGIGFDCRVLASTGVHCLSVMKSIIDVAVMNATYAGLWLDVVTGSNDNDILDTQHNRIRYAGHQLGLTPGDAASAATSVYMTGTATANVSLNEFNFTIVHNTGPAVICQNSDNNEWWLDTYAAGAAYESVSMLGGASAANTCRSERFRYVTGNKPIHVYGTGGGTPFAYASVDNMIFVLDSGNGTPDPVVEAGAQCSFHRSSSPYGDAAPIDFATTLGVTTGTISGGTIGGWYSTRNGITDMELNVYGATITGAPNAFSMSIPFTLGGSLAMVFHGIDFATGKSVKGGLLPGTNIVYIQNYDGSCPASGMNIVINGRLRL